jgi:phosphoribosylglycinamide formyltransferase 1
MTRVVVLISGRGSNMEAVVKACESGEIDATVVAVIANRPDAAGLTFANAHGIDTIVCDHSTYPNRNDFDLALANILKQLNPDWIVLAGFIRILGAELVQQFVGRMINIHPSLLPKYPGLNTHERALNAGDTEHGATVHFVTPELDAGPVIEQVSVPILEGDTTDVLAARVLREEHGLLVKALKRCVKGNASFTQPD